MEVAEENARLMSNRLAKMEVAMETVENRVISQVSGPLCPYTPAERLYGSGVTH